MQSTTEYQDMGDITTKLSATWAPVDPAPEEAATFEGACAGMMGDRDHMFGQIEACLATL